MSFRKQSRRILIVDDEPGFTHLFRMTLERAGGFDVREVNNPMDAVAAARDFRPDLIFLDVVMPHLDGGDVAVRLREDPLVGRVPLVFLTAIVSERESGDQTIAGIPFLPKPISLGTLRECIREHLGD